MIDVVLFLFLWGCFGVVYWVVNIGLFCLLVLIFSVL